MLIGYARVSTSDQDLTLQLDALTAAGCEKVFSDKASGTKADRDGLAEALAYAREGDSLVVWKLDRLGRSMKGLVDLAATLEARKVDLRSLTDGIDTSSLSDLRFRKPPNFTMRNEKAGFSRLCGLLDGFLLVFPTVGAIWPCASSSTPGRPASTRP